MEFNCYKCGETKESTVFTWEDYASRTIRLVCGGCWSELTAYVHPILPNPTKQSAIETIDAECMDIMRRKNKDYGQDNIGKFGVYGVVVRMNDKLERIINLVKRPDYEGAVVDESLEDTLLDLRNYAVITLLLLREQWDLPWGVKP